MRAEIVSVHRSAYRKSKRHPTVVEGVISCYTLAAVLGSWLARVSNVPPKAEVPDSQRWAAPQRLQPVAVGVRMAAMCP